MRLETMLILVLGLQGLSNFHFILDSPQVGNRKKVFYKKKDLNYSNQTNYQMSHFPIYAKTSKMINGNRYGRHSMERSFQREFPDIQKKSKGGRRNGSK